ncbi:MAG: glycosyltransferase [Lachnospiraceae bacterium]|nr:glycosyltransferase [Lachnospiraceae bacterium]
MKKISVIVPCYNVANYLPWCIDHLIRQTIGVENIEIILVDDASTDNGATREVILAYEKQYPESVIAVLLDQNKKQGGARNVGIFHASGEYLMFCDADDWLAPLAMEAIYETAVHYDADVTEYRYKAVTEYIEIEEKIEEGNSSYIVEFSDKEVKRNMLMLSTDEFSFGCMRKMYRMSLIKEHDIRFVEGLICEEPSFTLPVRIYEKRHVFIDAELYYYYQRPDSTIHGNWDANKMDNIKVWLLLMEDLKKRGVFADYEKELEYMFYEWGFGLSISMMLYKGYHLKAEEITILKEILFRMFPNILKNLYFVEKKDEWDIILKRILEQKTELTQDDMKDFHHKLIGALH